LRECASTHQLNATKTTNKNATTILKVALFGFIDLCRFLFYRRLTKCTGVDDDQKASSTTLAQDRDASGNPEP